MLRKAEILVFWGRQPRPVTFHRTKWTNKQGKTWMALGAERVLEVALQSCIPSVASFTPHHRNHKPVFQVRNGGQMQAESQQPVRGVKNC